jgi:hypothetical protein
MSRLFIFGIGGTGARVLKSLTLMLASGVNANGAEIIPIIIDPHKDLPELINCKSLLALYSRIHKGVYKNTSPESNTFYQTPMSSLAEASRNAVSAGFDFDERIDETFGDYIGYDLLPRHDINRDLIDLLYSQKNLNTPLSVGFKGNPNIGSVVLNKFDKSHWYQTFETVFSEGDRIFIVSSIFGGTGAAGFPLLLKNMRSSKNLAVKNAVIGAVPVMPYFKLSDANDQEHNDIDSNSFFTKTKTALSYYEKNLKEVDTLYYLADPHEQTNPYINNEKKQENKAHLVELIGASAILHFCLKSPKKPEKTEFYQYSLLEDARAITFKNLGNELRNEIAMPLVNYYLFAKLHEKFKAATDAPFILNERFDQTFFRTDLIQDIEKVNNQFYLPWITELNDNDRKFGPLNLILEGKDNYHKLVIGHEVAEKTGVFKTKVPFNTSNYINRMETKRNVLENLPKEEKITRYLLLVFTAINEVNQEKFKMNK